MINQKYSLGTTFVKMTHPSYFQKHTLVKNDFSDSIKDKRIISLSPGGFKGFYVLGICKYIKKNYNLDNYVFSGASAGAWNSLLLCYKGSIDEIQENIIDNSLQNTKSIKDLENLIIKRILTKYNAENFDLNKLFIGVTTLNDYKTNTTIYSNFSNLEDALNCCMASSHIPLVTGGLVNVYRNVLSFDGGFSKYPYLNTSNAVLHITPSMWVSNPEKRKKESSMKITDYTTLFSKEKYHFIDMIENGFKDSERNKHILDSIFLKED